MKVTPWEVAGKIDYEKLIKEFGVKPLDKKLLTRIEKHAPLHYMLRRNIFFAHTYFDTILDAVEKNEPVYLYTGRAPSGPVHLGHIVPWLFTKWLQDVFKFKLIFQIPDEEKFLFKNVSMEETKKWTEDNILDIIAMGFDPKLTKVIIDTQHVNKMYTLACEVAKRTTASTAKALFGFKDSDNVGKYFYSCMQSVPCFLPTELEGKPTRVLIPCAIDQDVHFRLTRDVAARMGYPKPSTILCRFLPALTADAKMSSSADLSITTTDSPSQVKKKINKYAFSGGRDTLEEHKKLGGNPDIDISYQYLTFFEESDVIIENAYRDYKAGTLLSGELKAILIDTLNTFLAKHQKARQAAKGKVQKFLL